ncbi:MAG: hypothetical protein LC803_09440 [Acidobacteria bacterium]|nr:hypothetical protein [Acidobacteriota bacterium]
MRMNKFTFPHVTKRKGTIRDYSPIYLDPLFKVALHNFAKRQTSIAGTNVSMSNVVQTALRQRYKEIDDEYTNLKKQEEQENAKKYLDGIKTKHQAK